MTRFPSRIIRAGVPTLFALVLMLGTLSDALAQTRTRRAARGASYIPRGTEMKIRLNEEINTKESRDGDRFTATVLTPSRYADSTIEGHVARIDKSGKLKGKTELSLAFDRIRLRSGEDVAMDAQVVRVYGEDSANEVDEEGNVRSSSQGNKTAVRTGGGAAVGAVIGAIAGGGKGAAIGAAIGAGAGAGSTYIQGSKKIKLEPGTEILIRTTR